jgi:hypothetical protein
MLLADTRFFKLYGLVQSDERLFLSIFLSTEILYNSVLVIELHENLQDSYLCWRDGKNILKNTWTKAPNRSNQHVQSIWEMMELTLIYGVVRK